MALKKNREYKCGINVFMMDMLRPASMVPTTEKSIDMYRTWHFAEPAPCTDLELCILEGSIDDVADHSASWGKLIRTSPDEQIMAFFRACPTAVKNNENKNGWKQNYPHKFVHD